MPVVDVLNLSGKKVGQVDLADAVFGAKVNPHLLHEASRWYQREIRSGTHKTKDKSEVSGAGRKPRAAKGTGRARVGSIRSPLWRHGGTVPGPKPRDYQLRAAQEDVARRAAFGAFRKARVDQKLAVIDEWSLDTHKTKALAEVLGNLKHTKSSLIVSHGENRNLELATRNLDRVKLVAPNAVQVYDLLNHDLLLLSKDAVARLVRTLDPEAAAAATPHVESIAPAPAAKKEAAPKAAKSGAKKPAAKKTAAKPGKKGK